MRNLVGEEGWSGQARRLAGWLNPVVASPAAPLETFAALDAVGPSLMPRTSRLQGIAMGLGTLGARATAGAAERLTNMAVPTWARPCRDATRPSERSGRWQSAPRSPAGCCSGEPGG